MCSMSQVPPTHRFMLRGLKRLSEHVLVKEEPSFPGSEDVIVGETAIATTEGGLQYRGYPIEELAAEASFLEVAYLLLYASLPNQEQLADFRSILVESAEVAPELLDFLAAIPLHVGATDVLRTGISALGQFDPQLDDDSREGNIAKAVRLLAQIPILIAARYRQTHGLPLVESNPELSYAANVLRLITGKDPPALHERAMDVSLILCAEHEINASSFAARMVASIRSDLYSAVVAAVGALKGPLDGGASEPVMQVLGEVGSPENAEPWIREALAEKVRVRGFGHPVYKTGDPRATILKAYCAQLAAETGGTGLEEIAEVIEEVIREEKGVPPNLDWPSARLYHYLGLDVDLHTPLFVASRVVGWAAHAIEQAENNRPICPRSNYIGPARREFKPLADRG